MDIAKPLLEIRKANVEKFVNHIDVYNHYLNGKAVFNKPFSSPFREDKHPSFVINKTGYFRDFATGESGDCYAFVMKLYNIGFYESLKQVVCDLGLKEHFYYPEGTVKQQKKLQVKNVSHRAILDGDFNLTVKTRKYEEYDLEYWNSYGVSLRYLKIGNVYPISHYFVNGKMYVAEKYAYVYVEIKDNKETYKVYQPFSVNMKWINGNNYSVWELWRLLPKTHDELIITSSRKDALSIIENCKIPATSFQAESINPKPHVVEAILKRFKKVYLFYDNDYSKTTNWGQENAKKRLIEFPFTNLIIPDDYESKDFSDLVYNYGRATATNILKQLINDKT